MAGYTVTGSGAVDCSYKAAWAVGAQGAASCAASACYGDQFFFKNVDTKGFDCTGIASGETCEFVCQDGYEVVGTVTCDWSTFVLSKNPVARCERMRCAGNPSIDFMSNSKSKCD